MDISFKTDHGRFNYRVSAVILRNECLLTVRDNLYAYSYLPGGRVKMGEHSIRALQREIQEELRTKLTILRLLWLCEDFFTEEDISERFHEICLYYLVDAGTLPRAAFFLSEGTRINHFEWIPLSRLGEIRLYPEFIQKEILHLPEQLKMLTETHI